MAWQIERVRLLAMKPDGRFKLPALDTLLIDPARSRRQTPQQQRALLQQISAQLGIPLIRRGGHGEHTYAPRWSG